MYIKKPLSRRQLDVAKLAVIGWRREEIAEKLCVSHATVKFHLTNIYKHFDVDNQVEFMRRWREWVPELGPISSRP